MRMRFIAAVVLAPLVALAACGGDAHKGEHCVHSHEETYMINGGCMSYVTIGTVMTCVSYMQIPVTDNVCDHWVKDSPSPAIKDGGN